ncbi:YEATS domain-containing protein 2 [Saguinus oedipus]|uniref:YEATS domain-containing protein 2 n=1 Tax=Saguinus oedipus TaxID=9490 RepID=A0ABQ9U337_SAGOE|nr:YEATS domain-containing protein 2 [Saguinus oedipus]
MGEQSEGTAPMSSSTVSSVTKTSGQPQVCVSQATMGTCKVATPTVVSTTSLVSTPNPISGKATVSGLLKIHSSQSNPQQAVLTIPSQLKPLSVNTSGGVQTILMPVNKVKTEPETPGPSCLSQEGQTAVKTEESSELGNYVIKLDHLETIQQLLTAVVKKIPLITAKSEDASCFSAKSVEQYYGWNIGKRRAAEWQRAMTMRKVLQEILEKNPRFHHLTPLKTKHIAHWCRCHGYTPPDPESLRSDGDSIEDVLTQIDSEPGKPVVAFSGTAQSTWQPGAFAGVERGEDLEEVPQRTGASANLCQVLPGTLQSLCSCGYPGIPSVVPQPKASQPGPCSGHTLTEESQPGPGHAAGTPSLRSPSPARAMQRACTH